MYFPTPTEIAQAIAKTMYPEVEKKLILLRLKNMSKNQISRLYQALLDLHKAEDTFVSTVNKIDLKYELKFQEAYADSQELKPKHN